ncbi:MAG: undecaprenyl-diphosphate phosphatase [Vicinamibacterales bacterium]
MNLVLYVKAIILGVVEGVTEFLPVSSTGHLILAGALLDFNNDKGKIFEIVIQTGAMLAVVWEFRSRFISLLAGLSRDASAQRLALNLVMAFVPAALVGVLAGEQIKQRLFNSVTVATAFIVGGLFILWAERRTHRARIERVDDLPWPVALQIGCAQCLALVPGTSRSAATIVGGLLFGLSRQAATEFSFFLAVPTLVAAGVYELYKQRALLSLADAGWFLVGSVTAFISALVCVRWLLRYVASHDFRPFAYYRIAFGAVILVTAYAGMVSWASE